MKTRIILTEDIEVTIEHDGKTVKDYSGDENLIHILRNNFSQPIIVIIGDTKENKKEIVSTTRTKTLKPGDDGYVDAVLLEVFQNRYDMRIVE